MRRVEGLGRAQCRTGATGRVKHDRCGVHEHAEEVAQLHLRTIEALAMAIEAKDQATHDHLRRVRTYVEEIGKEMQLTALELDALRAAALLHDIGKFAVPEHIISKPGKMTAEEFEKMKIHPIVGAEILDCVGFPPDYLHLYHRRRIAYLDAYQTPVLEEPDSAVKQPLNEAFLALRQAAESDE